MPSFLTELQTAAAALLRMPALHLLNETCLAAHIAFRLEYTDAPWIVLVAPPSSGKTEVLRAVSHLPHTHMISTLTRAALLTGARRGEEHGGQGAMLERFRNAPGTLIIKDLTSLMHLHKDERNEILSWLREVYDGQLAKAFAHKYVEWEGRVGLLGAVTPVIDQANALQTLLGERFLMYRIAEEGPQERLAQAQHAVRVNGKELALRQAYGEGMVRAYQATLEHIQAHGLPEIPHEVHEQLLVLANLAAWGRAAVPRNGYREQICAIPTIESPTRIAKQLEALLMALVLVRGREVAQAVDLDVIQKIARDCLPPSRLRTLQALYSFPHPFTPGDLARATGMTEYYAERSAEDCVALNLGGRNGQGMYYLTPETREFITKGGLIPVV